MQPYQQAEQEQRRIGESPYRTARNVGAAIGGAASAYLGGAALQRVMPLLSKYVPQSLATKGLSKIDPRFGTFIQKAMDDGHDYEEIRQFIESKGEEASKQVEEAEDNPIPKFSPKLDQLIKKARAAGHTTQEIEGMARSSSNRLSKDVDLIEKTLGMRFIDLLRHVYGNDESKAALQEQPQVQQMQQQPQSKMDWASTLNSLKDIVANI